MAAVLTVSVPGIMNMALTAKADLITWLLQLIMLGCFFQYIHVYENHWIFLSGAAGSYFLSLTMKPTSLVFSTAVFGMMGAVSFYGSGFMSAGRRLTCFTIWSA